MSGDDPDRQTPPADGDGTVDSASPTSAGVDRTRQKGRLARGAVAGRYIILDTLGEGGMGVVYAAYDPELDRKVAIKLLHARAEGQETRARLLREAQAMARLSHPNVIPVFDVGTIDEQVFVSMELVEGESLRDWERRQQRPWREVVALYVQAGRGLAAAHAAGLVHRDFKSANAMIGNDGRVRVLDFGLARLEHGAVGDEITVVSEDELTPSGSGSGSTPLAMHLTRTGALVGTPAYMAPEQVQGLTVDGRSDQFSFCVALFRALYGELPYAGRTIFERSENILRGEVRPPPARTDVPRWLRQVLVRGLACNPDDRFPTVGDLLAALARDPMRQRRQWIAAAGFVAVAAAIGIVVWTAAGRSRALCGGGLERLQGVWDPARKSRVEAAFAGTGLPYADDAWLGVERALDAYAATWVTGYEDACTATHLRGEQSPELLDLRMLCLGARLDELRALTELLVDADDELVQRAVEAAAGLGRVTDCADTRRLLARERPPVDPSQRSRVEDLQARVSEASVLIEAGRYRSGLEVAAAAVAAAEELGYNPLLAEARYVHGRLLRFTGRLEEAEDEYVEGVAAAVAGRADDLLDDLSRELAWVLGPDLAEHRRSVQWGKIAEAAVARAGNRPEDRGALLHTLGTILYAQGKYEAASERLREALTLREQGDGAADVETARTLNTLGVIANMTGDQDAALDFHRRALAIREAQLGRDHPVVAESLNSLANVLNDLGDAAAAEDHFRRALGIWERTTGLDHPRAAGTLNNLAIAVKNQDRLDEAMEHYETALAVFRRLVGEEHPWVAMTLVNIGELHVLQARYQDALTAYEKALTIDETVLGKDHPDLAYDLVGIGRVFIELGKAERAVAPLARALELRERAGATVAELAEVRFQLARALWGSGRRGDRPLALATAARDGFVAAGGRDTEVAKVEEWLAAKQQ